MLETWLSTKYPDIKAPAPDPSLGHPSLYQYNTRITESFLAAAQLCPSGDQMNPDVQVGLGVLFFSAGKYQYAADCFSAALDSTVEGALNDQSNVHLLWNRIGATQANMGHYKDAIESYEMALVYRPNFSRARYNLAVVHFNQRRYRDAASSLLHVLTEQSAAEASGKRIVGEGLFEQEKKRKDWQGNLEEMLRKSLMHLGRYDLSENAAEALDIKLISRALGI